MAIYATPHLALLPIFIVWLGIGMQSKIAVAFVGGVIPILVNSMAGVRGVERSWVTAARSFCAREWDVFVKVILPASLPGVIMGIRLGVSRAVLGVVVAEMYQSQAGVGNKIMLYGRNSEPITCSSTCCWFPCSDLRLRGPSERWKKNCGQRENERLRMQAR